MGSQDVGIRAMEESRMTSMFVMWFRYERPLAPSAKMILPLPKDILAGVEEGKKTVISQVFMEHPLGVRHCAMCSLNIG